MYDFVETHVHGLRSLGVLSDSYGSLLSSVLINKLPQEFRLIVSRRVKDEDWSLQAIMEVIEQEIEATERAMVASVAPGKKPGRDQPTAMTLLSSNSEALCCYCQQTHPASSCKNVTRVEARKEILRKAGRCFNCLRRVHVGR